MADFSPTLEWKAPTHLRGERSADWYWALGLVSLAGIIASIYWSDYLFAGIIGLGAMMLGFMAARAPRECDVHLSDKGLTIDRDFYPYRSLRSFWIETHNLPAPKLYVATTGLMHPHLGIILQPPAETEMVRSLLRQYVPEETRHSVGTIFALYLGL